MKQTGPYRLCVVPKKVQCVRCRSYCPEWESTGGFRPARCASTGNVHDAMDFVHNKDGDCGMFEPSTIGSWILTRILGLRAV